MKTFIKIFLMSSLSFASIYIQCMELEPCVAIDPSVGFIDESITSNIYALIESNNHRILSNKFWNDPEAVRGIRDVILDTSTGLAMFYLWVFHPSNIKQLHRRMFTLADDSSCSLEQSSSPGQIARAGFQQWSLDQSNFEFFSNSLVDQFYDLFLKIRAIMAIAYKLSPVEGGLFQERDKYWNQTADFSDEAIKDFVGTHELAGLVDDALVKLFTLRMYLRLLQRKTEASLLIREIGNVLDLIENIATSLNMMSDGDYAARHLRRIEQPSTANQDDF